MDNVCRCGHEMEHHRDLPNDEGLKFRGVCSWGGCDCAMFDVAPDPRERIGRLEEALKGSHNLLKVMFAGIRTGRKFSRDDEASFVRMMMRIEEVLER